MQAVVDRPDEIRRAMPFKRLILTDMKMDLTRLAKKKELQQALNESGKQPNLHHAWANPLPHSELQHETHGISFARQGAQSEHMQGEGHAALMHTFICT